MASEHAPNRIRIGYPDRTPTDVRTYGLTEKSDPDVIRPTAVDASARTEIQPWSLSWRADPHGAAIADRQHYNRQSVGSAQFVPPGRCLVLTTPDVLWVTSWPFAEYVKHEWPGAWMNSTFRREGGPDLASDLIRTAVAATRWNWPDVPELGMVTFVDAGKVRRKRDPGRCYIRAGFRLVGRTKAGLLAFQMLPDEMPEPLAPIGAQLMLGGVS